MSTKYPDNLKELPTRAIIFYFIMKKPGMSTKYYNIKYSELFGLTGSRYGDGTGASKWFQELRKRGYIRSERIGNEMYHYPIKTEWVDDRKFIDEVDSWEKVDKNGEIHE